MSVALHSLDYYLALYPKKHHKDFTFISLIMPQCPFFSYVLYRNSVYKYRQGYQNTSVTPSFAPVFQLLVAAEPGTDAVGKQGFGICWWRLL